MSDGEKEERGDGVELVEVGGGVSEKWERKEVHVTADREEKDFIFHENHHFLTACMSRTAWPIFISFGSNFS